MPQRTTCRCPLCQTPYPVARLSAATWLAPAVVDQIVERYAAWQPAEGACANCARLQIQRCLTERALAPPGDPPLPAWECLPTPFRVGADPRFTGAGVTIAFIDSAFYPHPDLVRPRNRIRAWVDATGPRLKSRAFAPDVVPRWPGHNAIASAQWHGLMSSGIAAGNGRLSHGLYRGLASEADIILVQTMDARRKITNVTLTKALSWLAKHGPAFGLRVVSFSVAGDPLQPDEANLVDAGCERLVKAGVVVVAAVGNSGRNVLVAPASCPDVIAVGGYDDRDRLDARTWRLWNSSYGIAADGTPKPDVIAPSWRVVAPLLPHSSVAQEALELFACRLLGDRSIERRIDDQKLVTPYYQHMDGTSTAAPIVSSAVACMLQANPGLSPQRVKELLTSTASPIADAPIPRQGFGAINAGNAVAAALEERNQRPVKRTRSRRRSRH